MATRITESLLKKHPRPKTGQTLVWDDLVAGFGARLTPTAVCFVVQYRDGNGRKPRESLKRWPACGVDEVRNLARARLAEVLGYSVTGGAVPLRLAARSWFARESVRKGWRRVTARRSTG